mgnify:CR=1 FL=1|jgi:hypothetical protein
MAKSAKLREEQIWRRQQRRAEVARISGRIKKKSKKQGKKNVNK